MAMRISDIIIWILFIASIVMFIWYIFGNSPSFEQMILVLILTILITNVANTREVKIRLMNIEKSFHALAGDFKNHIRR